MVAKKKDLEKKILQMQNLEFIRWDVPDHMAGKQVDNDEGLKLLLAEAFPGGYGAITKEEEWSTTLPGFVRYIVNTAHDKSPTGERCFAYECGKCRTLTIGPPNRLATEETIGPKKDYRNGKVKMDYFCTNKECEELMFSIRF